MDTHKKIREHISAFADGTLCNIDRELAMAALQTSDGRQTWQLYHRIGDVLRSDSVPELSPGFSERLAARLDGEPLPLRRNLKSAVAEAIGAGTGMHLLPAASTPPAAQPAATIAPGAGAVLASPAPAASEADDTSPGSGAPDSGAGGGAMSQARPAIISIS